TFILLTSGAIWLLNGFSIDVSTNSPVHLFEFGLVVLALVSAFFVIIARSRLTAIIIVGVIGYIVALFFVLFGAPDLALTQLVIETVTVALFLLCYYHLPELRKETFRIKVKA